jgi:AraC-like DNA-binding protein
VVAADAGAAAGAKTGFDGRWGLRMDDDDLYFEGDDLGQTEEFLTRAYTEMKVRRSGDRSSVRIARRWLGEINFDDLEFDYTLGYDANPLGRICLTRIRSGHIVEKTNGETTDVFSPGDLTLYAAPDLPFAGEVVGATYDLAMFDPVLLSRVAAADWNRRVEAVRLTGRRPVSVDAHRQLSAVIDYFRDNVLEVQEARESPLIMSSAAQHLAATVLTTMPNNAKLEPTATDRRDAKPVLLRRAIAYIDENAQNDIALADIAAAVYVTPRALQYMFRRHLGTTPMEHVRRVRMDLAHQELVTNDRSTTTVSAVARRWGFSHIGRFAARYRKTYGCSPNETLDGAQLGQRAASGLNAGIEGMKKRT